MADNKKSVIVYAEWLETFNSLTDEEAGKLIKHFFKYVNDLDPEAPDRLTELSFIPIKQSLKRDLKKWDEIKKKRSEAGKASAEKRKQKQQMLTSVESVEQSSTNPTVNVNDNVNVNVNVNDNVINNIYREFKHLKITVEEYQKLKDKFIGENIDQILDDIENYKNNKNYTSLYLTANKWLTKRVSEKGLDKNGLTKKQQTWLRYGYSPEWIKENRKA